MKNRNILILLALTIILAGGVVASLYFLDGVTPGAIARGDFGLVQLGFHSKPRSEDFKRQASRYLYTDSQELGPIKKIEAEELSLALTIAEGDNKVEIASHTDIPLEDYISYDRKTSTLKISDLSDFTKASFFDTNTSLVIYINEDTRPQVQLGIIDGVLTIDKELGSLKVDEISGVFVSNSEESYDIYVGSADGIITLNFDQMNAHLTIDYASGIIAGQASGNNMFGIEGAIDRKFGQARDRIHLDSAEGIITISDLSLDLD